MNESVRLSSLSTLSIRHFRDEKVLLWQAGRCINGHLYTLVYICGMLSSVYKMVFKHFLGKLCRNCVRFSGSGVVLQILASGFCSPSFSLWYEGKTPSKRPNGAVPNVEGWGVEIYIYRTIIEHNNIGCWSVAVDLFLGTWESHGFFGVFLQH